MNICHRKHQIGVIGFGVWGCHSLERELAATGRCEIRRLHAEDSLGDNCHGSALQTELAAFAAGVGAEISGNWRDIIDDPDIDIVSVMTAPYCKPVFLKSALDAGKFVVTDKPLGMAPEKLRELRGTPDHALFMLAGYWNRPDETANTFRNGWLYTGDIAIMDEDGYFAIVDRKKDMIVVGGYNVYPREIDEVLHEHPLVKEAVSVGISHPTRGETIKAYIVPVEGATLTKEEIISHCRKRLANYKMPRQVEFRDELPKTLVGKILRRALVAEEQEKFAAGRHMQSCHAEADDHPEQDHIPDNAH